MSAKDKQPPREIRVRGVEAMLHEFDELARRRERTRSGEVRVAMAEHLRRAKAEAVAA